MKRTRIALAVAIIFSCPFSAQAELASVQSPPPNLNAVLSNSENVSDFQQASRSIPQIRLDALKSAALSYGTQSGLARRSYEIALSLQKNKERLDSIYNFAALLLDKNVQPPVLSLAENNLNQSDSDTIRLADATYRIESQARFVTVPPTWRDYLLNTFTQSPELPADVLLPQTSDERTVWKDLVTEGWKLGIQQANQILEQSIARLDRDYKGMVLYRRLLASGMIGLPYVAEARLGVTGDGNAININDRILRITSKPMLVTNPGVWKPILAPGK